MIFRDGERAIPLLFHGSSKQAETSSSASLLGTKLVFREYLGTSMKDSVVLQLDAVIVEQA